MTADQTSAFEISFCSSLQRVFIDGPAVGESTIEMAAAANGWASAQVVISAHRHARLSNVRVTVSAFESWKMAKSPPGTWELVPGASIPASACNLSRVHYVRIESPSPGRTSAPGLYPDPLEPLTAESRFDVEAGTQQPVWLTIKVPPGSGAGSYQATVTVEADAQGEGTERRSGTVRLRVFGFRLPKRRILHIWSTYNISAWQAFYNWMSREEVLKAWEDGAFLLARYGITPSTVPAAWFGAEPDFQYYETFYRKILDLGAPHLEIAPESWPVVVRNGWERIAYTYHGSEWPREESPKYAALIRDVLEKAPGVKVSVAGVKPDEWLEGLVKVWIYISSEPLDSVRERIRRGEEAWWYVCCGPTEPFANVQVDAPQIDPRILCWQLFQYRCTGFYYWRASQLGENVSGTSPEEKWPNRPWSTATSDVPPSHNDGQLVYPGPDGKAWSCIRLENMRDGAEDYDYLRILARYVRKLKKAGIGSNLVRRTLNALIVNPELSAGLTEYTKDPRVVEKERCRVGGLIEEARVALGETAKIVSTL